MTSLLTAPASLAHIDDLRRRAAAHRRFVDTAARRRRPRVVLRRRAQRLRPEPYSPGAR